MSLLLRIGTLEFLHLHCFEQRLVDESLLQQQNAGTLFDAPLSSVVRLVWQHRLSKCVKCLNAQQKGHVLSTTVRWRQSASKALSQQYELLYRQELIGRQEGAVYNIHTNDPLVDVDGVDWR